MSAVEQIREGVATLRRRSVHHRQTATRVLFGDRLGVVVFLSTLLVSVLFWPVAVTINDNFTLINALVAVSEGQLHFERIAAGAPWSPGTHLVDGRVYGRNYGQVVLALPFLWVLEAVGVVADPRLAVFALLGLLVVGLGTQLGRLTGRERAGALGGAALGLAVFAPNAALATPLPTEQFPLMALQLQSMVATGLAAVLLYRLVGGMHGRRSGAFAALALAGGTPIAVWSNIPKRHALSTLFVVFVVYAFYRARAADSVRGERRFRAGAYAATALFAWVHAPEAGVVAVALAAVDLPTARSNDLRSLGTIGGAFGVAALPFLVTNWLISGNPLLPPRFLPGVPESGDGTGVSGLLGGGSTGTETVTAGTDGDAATAGSDSATSGDGEASSGTSATADAERVLRRILGGLTVGLREPDRLVQTFLRSGYIDRKGTGATNLTVLESAPIVGALFALPVLAAKRAVRGVDRTEIVTTPERATDALVVVVTALFVILYLPSLPLRVQFSVRYLLPVYALGVYGVVRLATVRGVLRRALPTLVWTVAGTVLVGSQLVIAWLGVVNPGAARGTILQFHALLGIAAGVLLGAYVTLDAVGSTGRRSAWNARVGAVALGLAVGVGAVLVVLASLRYLGSGESLALPLLRHLAALLEAI